MDVVDLDRYPLHRPESTEYNELVERCRGQLRAEGLFNVPGFMRTEVIKTCLADIKPVIATQAFVNSRKHNIYFEDHVADLAADHPALRHHQDPTSNRTICADQIEGTAITALYDWPAFAAFLARVVGKPALFTMDDRLAGANCMHYDSGYQLNWHFDRAEFTVTLLLQEPAAGGEFEYCKDLRSTADPNYPGVVELLSGERATRVSTQSAGTLSVFRGVNTAHR